jgi:3'(2'), 5'-bisphosphate nucleotidase
MTNYARELDDAQLAACLAEAAGRILLDVRGSGLIDGKALGNAGDETANQFLCHAIRHLRPDDGLLSEECKDTEERLSKERVWIIDPVDGTREYGEERTDWAVHVGMAVNGAPDLGAVALPGLDVVLRSDQPGEIPAAPEKLRMVVSRTRPAKEATGVCEAIGGELVPMGSAGAKAMAILRGEADIYLHSGGQYEWDSMAPAAVALGWGLHASRIDGSPLVYNQQDVYMPDLLICRKEHADMVLEKVRAFL